MDYFGVGCPISDGLVRALLAQSSLQSYNQAWMRIPAMKGREFEVKSALESPDEVRQSKSDVSVLLFYKTEALKRWVCAVTKRSDEEGFLITAYPTDAIKEGTKIWPK